MALYHKNFGLPKFVLPAVIRLWYTPHATKAATTDRYGDLSCLLPKVVTTKYLQVVEIEVRVGRPEKYTVRYTTANGLDLVLVIAPDRIYGHPEWVVITVWANESEDDHKSLNPRRYTRVARPHATAQ